jgi:RNA polymerase sigma-B factor
MSTPIQDNLKLETLQLFKDYQKSKNIQLRNQIVELNFGLVRKESYHWSNQCEESHEDLLQIGCLGLIRAIERFDLEQGHAFSSFAIPYIRGEIQHYLRDKSYSVRIPRRWVDLGNQSTKVVREFRENFNRQPTDLEIAQILEITLKEWQEIKLAHQNREPISLDIEVGSEEGSDISLNDLIPDPNYRSFQLIQEDRIRLQQALGQLEERTRSIFEFVFFQDLTQKEAAEQLGISVVTVSRRIKKGIEFLKESMGKEIA